ncbi:MAG: hypothetical protein WC679_14045 [Bacteroidales bacterium]|jgi:hypothetical protein
MIIYWCKKHHFCPQDGQLYHCLSQDGHHGCKRLTTLPTQHPTMPNRGYYRAKEKALLQRLRNAS